MSLVCGIACAYVLQASLHRHIPRFLLLNAVLSTTTLPLAPLFRDPSHRSRALGVDAGEQAALLTRTEAGSGENPPVRTKGERLDTRGVLELNAILWLTDWRVALLLLGSTYILGMGESSSRVCAAYPAHSHCSTRLHLSHAHRRGAATRHPRHQNSPGGGVSLFRHGWNGCNWKLRRRDQGVRRHAACSAHHSGLFMCAHTAGPAVCRFSLAPSDLVMAIAWQYSQQALLFASTALVAACTFAVMPVALEIAVELTYHSGVELEGAINSWIAVIGCSVWCVCWAASESQLTLTQRNSITIYAADPVLLGVPLRLTGWLWLAFVCVGAAVLVPVEGRLFRTEAQARQLRAEGSSDVAGGNPPCDTPADYGTAPAM